MVRTGCRSEDPGYTKYYVSVLLHNSNLKRQRPQFGEDSLKIFIYLTAPGLSCGTQNLVP